MQGFPAGGAIGAAIMARSTTFLIDAGSVFGGQHQSWGQQECGNGNATERMVHMRMNFIILLR